MKWATCFAMGLVLIAAGTAVADEPGPASAPSDRPLRVLGTVVKVEGCNLVIGPVRSRGIRGGIQEDVTVPTDERTTFSVDYEPDGKLTDLKPGMMVTAISGLDDRLRITATSTGLFGTIVKLDGKKIVLKVWRPEGMFEEVTVVTDEKTKVFVLGTPLGPGGSAKLSDLKPDMRVRVHPIAGTAAKIVINPLAGPSGLGSGSFPATRPAFRQVLIRGTLVRVDGPNMVINARQKDGGTKEESVATDDKTWLLIDGEIGRLGDLKPGMSISTSNLPETPRHPAMRDVLATSPCLNGRVVRIDGKDVVLRLLDGADKGKEVTVATDGRTKVILLCLAEDDWVSRPRPGRLEDLSADMQVRVLPETGTAAKIIGHLVLRGTTQPATRPGR